MRKRIEQMARGKFHSKKAELGVSVQRIQEKIPFGKSIESSFSIFSKNMIAITGYVFSTNKKVELLCEPSFSTKEYVIEYRVSGETSRVGTEEKGKFVFLTDAGELEVPFYFEILQEDSTKIFDFDTFLTIAQNNIEDGMEYFCDQNYMKYLLKDKREYQCFYKQLMQSRDKRQGLEQFLVLLQKKKMIFLTSQSKEIEVHLSKEEYCILLVQEGEGYIEGEIITYSPRIYLNETKLSDCKKIENNFLISFTVHNTKWEREYVDEILVSYGVSQIQITVKFLISEDQKRLWELFRLKQKEKQDILYLYQSWFSYMIGSIAKEEYEKRKECIQSERKEKIFLDPEKDYVNFITQNFQNIVEKGEKQKVCYDLYQQGIPSSFLYYEMIKDRNEEEDLVAELNEVEVGALLWGSRRQCLSEKLAQHTMNLIQKQRKYCSKIKRIAEEIYKQYPTRENLLILCMYLVKGSKIERKYHFYYDCAIGSYIKLLGIYECFLRSMGENYKKKIPRSVLLYFLDNQSLSDIEQERLYYNLFLYEKEYDTMLYHYSPKIQTFLKAQMEKGKINDNLLYLYEKNLSRIIQKEEMLKVFPNILFQHKITCYNPNIVGVYVHHRETKQGVYTALENGVGYVEIFTNNHSFSFINSLGEYYISGVSYKIEQLFPIETYSSSCYQWNQEHQLLSYYFASNELEKKETIISIVKKVLEYDTISEEFYLELLKSIIYLYEQQCDKEMSQYYLKKLNLSYYNKQERIYFINQMIKNDLYTLALNNIKRFSYEGIESELLEKLICYFEQIQKEDEILYEICNTCFERGDLGECSLNYLANTSIRPLSEMIQLWKISVKQRNCIPQLEENIIILALFEQQFLDGICDIFLSYYDRNGSNSVSIAFLRYLLFYCLIEKKQIKEELYQISKNLLLEEIITDRETILAFLYQCKQKIEKNDELQTKMILDVPIDWIEKQIDELEFYGMGMNFFHKFLPYLTKKRHISQYIEYYGEEGTLYEIEYKVENNHQKQCKKWKMKEIISGLFLSKYVLFYGETVYYTIWKYNGEEEKQQVKTGILFYDGNSSEMTGEYQLLNNIVEHMENHSKDPQVKDYMKDYLKKKNLFKNKWSLLE